MLGEQFGNYKFLSILGEGEMAVVYLAENILLAKIFAIKLLRQEFVHDSKFTYQNYINGLLILLIYKYFYLFVQFNFGT
jgi:serine/threonine protein kinase